MTLALNGFFLLLDASLVSGGVVFFLAFLNCALFFFHYFLLFLTLCMALELCSPEVGCCCYFIKLMWCGSSLFLRYFWCLGVSWFICQLFE